MSDIIGWVSPYDSYKEEPFGNKQKQALTELIRRRHYNFNYSDYMYMPNCTPLYKGNYVCRMTKKEFDAVMENAYRNINRANRLLPVDVIKKEENGVLKEKQTM